MRAIDDKLNGHRALKFNGNSSCRRNTLLKSFSIVWVCVTSCGQIPTLPFYFFTRGGSVPLTFLATVVLNGRRGFALQYQTAILVKEKATLTDI